MKLEESLKLNPGNVIYRPSEDPEKRGTFWVILVRVGGTARVAELKYTEEGRRDHLDPIDRLELGGTVHLKEFFQQKVGSFQCRNDRTLKINEMIKYLTAGFIGEGLDEIQAREQAQAYLGPTKRVL